MVGALFCDPLNSLLLYLYDYPKRISDYRALRIQKTP